MYYVTQKLGKSTLEKKLENILPKCFEKYEIYLRFSFWKLKNNVKLTKGQLLRFFSFGQRAPISKLTFKIQTKTVIIIIISENLYIF